MPNEETEEDVEIATPKKGYISPEERQKIINELRLVPKTKCIFLEINYELMPELKNIHISQRKVTNYW